MDYFERNEQQILVAVNELRNRVGMPRQAYSAEECGYGGICATMRQPGWQMTALNILYKDA